MKFVTAVLTAPRPHSTLGRTRASLWCAGFRGISERDGSPPEGSETSPRWCTAAYLQMFRDFLSYGTRDGSGLLVFEDDVIACHGLHDYLVNSPWPDDYEKIAAVSPYCCTAYSDYNPQGRWHREDHRETIAGTQSFLYTRHFLEKLVEYLEPDRCFPDGKTVGVDVQIGWCAKKHGLGLWYHIPSLIQHTGICNSSVGFTTHLGTIYEAETFVGTDFDARSLL